MSERGTAAAGAGAGRPIPFLLTMRKAMDSTV